MLAVEELIARIEGRMGEVFEPTGQTIADFRIVFLTRPINLELFEKTLGVATYAIPRPEGYDLEDVEPDTLFNIKVDNMGELLDEVREDGVSKHEIKFSFDKVTVGQGENARSIGLYETVIWALYEDADSDEAALELITTAYGPEVVTNFGDRLSRLKEPEPEPEDIEAKLVNSPGTSFSVNHGFYLKAAAKAIFEIADTTDGLWECKPQNRSKLKAAFKGNPSACKAFKECDNANKEYAALLWELCRRLVSVTEDRVELESGEVAISERTIIKELSRTAQGHNQSAACKDTKWRELVHKCLEAWSSVQLALYHPKWGDEPALGYALQAEFFPATRDAQGNIIKNVWAFKPVENKFFALDEIAKDSRTLPLPNIKPKKRHNAWIAQLLEGDMLSQVRGYLYPTRGKGLEEFTARRAWKSVFESGDPKSGGDPSRKVKARIMRDIANELKEYARTEAKQPKPIFLTAFSTYDESGHLKNLEIKGSKTIDPEGHSIELGGLTGTPTKAK